MVAHTARSNTPWQHSKSHGDNDDSVLAQWHTAKPLMAGRTTARTPGHYTHPSACREGHSLADTWGNER